MSFLKMTDLDLRHKRVLIREDFNVPLEGKTITSNARILAAIPTIKEALRANAKVILLSHLGRPKEGQYDEALSLAPVAEELSKQLKQPVRLIKDWVKGGFEVQDGEVVLCENTRFNVGEKDNSEQLSRQIAALGDVYINDAFATAHRAEATTAGVAQYVKEAAAGLLLTKELEALGAIMENPKRPLAAIVGGSKVSTKLNLLNNIAKKVDILIMGGGIANTFLAAAGFPIGKSLFEQDLVEEAKKILALTQSSSLKIPLPVDVVVAKECKEGAESQVKSINEVAADDMILDIGPKSVKVLSDALKGVKTVLWNGPLGVFEIDAFAEGTEGVAKAVIKSKAYSVAGGGDTVAAIEKFKLEKKISYISTAGGAFLEYLEGKILPAVAALEEAAKRK